QPPFSCHRQRTTEIYTLSLHDALPIWRRRGSRRLLGQHQLGRRHRGQHGRHHRQRQHLYGQGQPHLRRGERGRPRRLQSLHRHHHQQTTRLNSSHVAKPHDVQRLS